MKSNSLGASYFLTFTEEEERIIGDALIEEGFELSAEGIKDYLLESLFESEEKEPEKNNNVQKIANIINENPEIIAAGMSSVAKLAGAMFNKKIFK